MPIFRITGDDRYLNSSREVYVDAASAEQASLFAHRRGIVNAEVVEIDINDMPPDARLFLANAIKPAPERTGNVLFDHPARSIALGILFGLLGFAAVMFVIRLVFGLSLVVIDQVGR